MSKHRSTAVVLAVLAFTLGQQAAAGEHNLEFKLVTKAIEVKSLEAPNVEGQTVSLLKMHGVAHKLTGANLLSGKFSITTP
jgi:catabolite regulation protein CreA